jgi:LPS export ABC transporter protein LptC
MPSALLIYKYLPVTFIACVIVAACGEKKEIAPTVHTHKIVPEEGIDIVSYLSEPGRDAAGNLTARVKGKLTAPYMLSYQRADSPYAEFPRTLHVDFYNDTMRTESQLDAHYGKYLMNQEMVYLRDSVVVKNILKGDTLRCRELWWNQHTERFFTDLPVRIYEPDKILYGTGMEADQNFRWYTIKKMTGVVLTSGNNFPK